jgi:hypothetical protein
MRERQRDERAALRERYRPYPDLEQWLRQQQHPELAEQWRYRAMEVPTLRGEHAQPARPRDIRDYVPEIEGDTVHYFRHGKKEAAGGAAFIDKGGEIAVHAWRERASVLAALQLAEQKWSDIEVKGNAQFKALCVALAVEHDIRLSNPELQARIVRERQRRMEARTMARGPGKTVQPTHPSAGDEKPAPARSAVELPATYERSVRAYARHYQDIVKRLGGHASDPSKVDAMVAVRMRATGHTRQEVETVLQHCAPLIRQKDEVRDWANYAAKTAAYAYGTEGERKAEELRRYWPQWEKLEGAREVQRERDGGMSR